MHKIQENKGFTLLEILLVIAAIGILAAIVLIAINPNRQLAQARNAIRQTDINTIQKAIDQQALDNPPGGVYLSAITSLTTPTEICGPAGGCGGGYIDLSSLVPTYIAAIPRDPQAVSPGSGYKVRVNPANNKISVTAGLAENNKVIANNPLIPWTPASLGSALSFWADANDETSMTLNNQATAQTISQWNDKSGNIRHLTQGTAGQQPTLVRGIGNLLRYTQEFDNAYWAKISTNVIANTSTAPNTTVTGDTVTATASNGNISFGLGTSVAVGQQYTVSIWAETTTNDVILLALDGGTGASAITNIDNSGVLKRYSATRTRGVGSSEAIFRIQIGNSGSSVRVWGAMVNIGSTPNSYIGQNNLSFDGTDDVMAITSATAGTIGVTNSSLFMVKRYVGSVGEDITFGLGLSNNGAGIRSLYHSGSGIQGYGTWSNDIGSSLTTDTGGVSHTWAAVQSGQSIFMTKDGNQDSTFPRSLPLAPVAIPTNGITTGSLSGSSIGTYYSNIEVSEAIASYSALSTLDRQRMEGYLAWKWGLQANLPSGHPFKNSAPIWGE
jgi:type IV pilus assembly protein PilA